MSEHYNDRSFIIHEQLENWKFTVIQEQLESWKGDARLYHVYPPLMGYEGEPWSYVVVSATIVPNVLYEGDVTVVYGREETYIFGLREHECELETPSPYVRACCLLSLDPDFAPSSWEELPGSYEEGLSHIRALINAIDHAIATEEQNAIES